MIKNKYYISITLCILLICCLFVAWKNYKQLLYGSILHNQGNFNYELFVNQGAGKISLLEEAQKSYSGSLDTISHEDTQHNYDYVSGLLEQYREQQDTQDEEQYSQQPLEENKSEEGYTGNQENTSGSGGENSEQQRSDHSSFSERSQEYYLGKQDEINAMSEDERKLMEAYIEDLKSQQEYYQESYNKKTQDSGFQSIFDSFFGDVDRGGERDW